LGHQFIGCFPVKTQTTYLCVVKVAIVRHVAELAGCHNVLRIIPIRIAFREEMVA